MGCPQWVVYNPMNMAQAPRLWKSGGQVLMTLINQVLFLSLLT
jgi:hypothetical protein